MQAAKKKMSEQTFTFKLLQAAKKTGGDKYVCETDDTFVVYFPQSVSRKDGKKEPIASLTMTVTVD